MDELAKADEAAARALLVDHVSKADVGAAARAFARGAGKGRKLATQGHSPVGLRGRPTYGVYGGTRAERVGVHTGVTVRRVAPYAAAAGAGAAADRKLSKGVGTDALDRHSRGAEVATGSGAALAGAGAVRARRASNALKHESHDAAKLARGQHDVVGQQASRMAGGKQPMTRANLASLGRNHGVARALEGHATETARAAWKASRRSKGAAPAAVGLAGATAALHHRDKPPAPRAASYR